MREVLPLYGCSVRFIRAQYPHVEITNIKGILAEVKLMVASKQELSED